LEVATLVIAGRTAEFKIVEARFFVPVLGNISESTSASEIHLRGTLVEFKKFLLKLKLGILGIVGICGNLKLARSYRESLMAFTRELTWSCWFAKRASSPRDEARLSVW
jgi:hypothetical protein